MTVMPQHSKADNAQVFFLSEQTSLFRAFGLAGKQCCYGLLVNNKETLKSLRKRLTKGVSEDMDSRRLEAVLLSRASYVCTDEKFAGAEDCCRVILPGAEDIRSGENSPWQRLSDQERENLLVSDMRWLQDEQEQGRAKWPLLDRELIRATLKVIKHGALPLRWLSLLLPQEDHSLFLLWERAERSLGLELYPDLFSYFVDEGEGQVVYRQDCPYTEGELQGLRKSLNGLSA